jgi:hypothetical protein
MSWIQSREKRIEKGKITTISQGILWEVVLLQVHLTRAAVRHKSLLAGDLNALHPFGIA